MFLASICKLDRSSLDDVQSELVTAILEVVFVETLAQLCPDRVIRDRLSQRQVLAWSAMPRWRSTFASPRNDAMGHEPTFQLKFYRGNG